MASRWLLEKLHQWTARDLCPHPNRRGRSWGFFHFPEHRAGSGRTQWRGRGSYLDLHHLLEGCVSYWTDWPWTFSHFSPSRRGRWVTQTFFSRWCLLDYLWPLSKLSRPKQQPWFLCSLSHCHLWLHRRSRSLYPPSSYHLHHCRLRNLERFGHHWWVLRLWQRAWMPSWSSRLCWLTEKFHFSCPVKGSSALTVWVSRWTTKTSPPTSPLDSSVRYGHWLNYIQGIFRQNHWFAHQ